jgi:hypothetical protein
LNNLPNPQSDVQPAVVVEKLLVSIQQKDIETFKSIARGRASTDESRGRIRKILTDTMVPIAKAMSSGLRFTRLIQRDAFIDDRKSLKHPRNASASLRVKKLTQCSCSFVLMR